MAAASACTIGRAHGGRNHICSAVRNVQHLGLMGAWDNQGTPSRWMVLFNSSLDDMGEIATRGDGCEILHQLTGSVFFPLLIGFQPFFRWCRISQPSTVLINLPILVPGSLGATMLGMSAWYDEQKAVIQQWRRLWPAFLLKQSIGLMYLFKKSGSSCWKTLDSCQV